MLKSLFSVFETTEAQLTKGAVMRLRLSSLLSLGFMPLALATDFLTMSKSAHITLTVSFYICALGLVYAYSTRIANRLWTPDKYLDEIEVERKHRIASWTLQSIMGVMVLVGLVSWLWGKLGYEYFEALTGPRAALNILALLFFTIISLQTIFAAWTIKPLTDGDTAIVKQDKTYPWIMVLIILGAAALGFFVNL